MITMESRTEVIKFERNKEESVYGLNATSKGKSLRGVAQGSKGGHAHGPKVQMISHLEVGDCSRHLLLSHLLKGHQMSES